MKTEKELKDEIVELSKQLPNSNGANAVYIKAKIEALNWALSK